MKSKNFNIKQDTLLKIFALVFALLLWLYVQAQQLVPLDTTTRNFSRVEIEWETNPNYAVVAISEQFVDISVRGVVDKINTLTNDDIVMKLNLKNYRDGKHTIELVPQLPKGVQLNNISPNRIDIVLDKWESQQYNVEIEYINELPSELVIEEVTFTPPSVTLEGASVDLNKVKSVVVPFNLQMQGVEATDLKPEARDAYNKLLKNINIKDDVSVNIKIKYKKWLPVKPNFIGELPEGVTYTVKPARVEVLGQKTELDILTELYTEDIDVSNIEKGDELDVKVKYPNNINPSTEDYNSVTITFK